MEPVVEPKDYLGLELEKEEPVVTEEDLEARLQEIRQMFATMEDLNEDRGVIEGDFVTLDFTGTLAGESLKELKSENYLLEIGSKTFVPGFEDQLIGMRKGESKDFRRQISRELPCRSSCGKRCGIYGDMSREYGSRRCRRSMSNFVKNFEKYESLEALKADVRKSLEEEKKRKIAADFEREISEKLLAKNDFEVPESFVERQIYYMMSDTQRRMVSGGMDPKKAAEFSFKLHDQFREEATKIVKTVLLIKNIAQQGSPDRR